jgi:hypothetical protein
VDRQATAAESHSQTCLQTLFFLSPYLWWENNRTTPACWKTYWNCIAFELGTLCRFFSFLFFFWCAVLFYFMRPFWWDNYRTTSEAPLPGLEGETETKIIKTETSLHLNLEGFFFYFSFCFILFYYIYFFFHLLIVYFYSYLSSFYFLLSILSVSLMPFQLTVD